MSNPCNLAISPSQDTSRTRKIELPAFSSCVSLMTSRGSWRHDLRPKTILDRHGREIKLKNFNYLIIQSRICCWISDLDLFSELDFMFGPRRSRSPHLSTEALKVCCRPNVQTSSSYLGTRSPRPIKLLFHKGCYSRWSVCVVLFL